MEFQTSAAFWPQIGTEWVARAFESENQQEVEDSANTPQPIGQKWPSKHEGHALKEIFLNLQN